MYKASISIGLLCLLVFATNALATPWYADFISPRDTTFDTLELFITSGGPLADPGLGNFMTISGNTATTWSGSLINPNYALATGTDDLEPFTMTNPPRTWDFALVEREYFASDKSQPLSYDLLVWNGFGCDLVSVSHVVWNGTAWISSKFEPPPRILIQMSMTAHPFRNPHPSSSSAQD
jgi:hypothetical protein